jgi:hypothetical protein
MKTRTPANVGEENRLWGKVLQAPLECREQDRTQAHRPGGEGTPRTLIAERSQFLLFHSSPPQLRSERFAIVNS